MRWLASLALTLMATGCSIHVGNRPVEPVLIAEPAHIAPVYVERAPGHGVARRARAAKSTPGPVAVASPTHRPAKRGRAAAKPPVEPRTTRPANDHVATSRPERSEAPRGELRDKATRNEPPHKPRAPHRFKLHPSDVPPIKDEPAGQRRLKRSRAAEEARSPRLAQPQKYALDLR